MRKSNQGLRFLHKTSFALVFFMCFALVASVIGFSNVGNTPSTAEALDNNTLLSATDYLQTLNYNGDYDFIQDITQTLSTGDYATRFKVVSNTYNTDRVSPLNSSSGDSGKLSLSNYGLDSTREHVTWNAFYNFSNFPAEIINSGILQMKVNYTISSIAATDWFSFGMAFNSSKTEYTEEKKDGAYFLTNSANGAQDTGWKDVTASYCTLVCYEYSSAAPSGADMTINSVMFRFNPDKVTPGYTIANGTTSSNRAISSALLPTSAEGADTAISNQALGSGQLSSMTYTATNGGDFDNAWAQSKGVSFTATSTDYLIPSTATISKDGSAAVSFSQAKTNGWVSSANLAMSGNDGNFSFVFKQNGTYVVEAKSISKRGLKISITIGRIDTTAPNAPSITTDATAWNGSGTVNLSLACTTDSSAPYKYYYKAIGDENAYPTDFSLTTGQLGDAGVVATDTLGDFNLTKPTGKYKICVVAVDAAGNFVAGNCVPFIVDANSPTISVTPTGVLNAWTNETISFELAVTNTVYSPVTYAYSTDNGVTWSDLASNMFSITSGTQITDYKFAAKSVAKPTYAANSNSYNVKFDKDAPAAPATIAFPVGAAPDWHLDYYIASWNIVKTFTAGADTYATSSKLYYVISDNENTAQTVIVNYDASGTVVDQSLNFNVGGAKYAGEKTITYWTVDQAGNKSADVVVKVNVDAKNDYAINASVFDNSIFGAQGGSVPQGLNNGKRGETAIMEVMTNAGYTFFKLVDTREGETDVTLYSLTDNKYTATYGVSSVVVYFRKNISVELDQTVFTYNGEKQEVTLKALLGGVVLTNADLAQADKNVVVKYGAEKALGGKRDWASAGYAVELDTTNYNKAASGDEGNQNYFITNATGGTLTINKAVVKIIPAANQSKYFDGTDNTLTYTFQIDGVSATALFGGDVWSAGALATAGITTADAGKYAITQGTLTEITDGLSSTSSANYTIQFDDSVQFTIKPRKIYFTFDSTAPITKDYDGRIDNTFAYNSSEVINRIDYLDSVGGSSLKAKYTFKNELTYTWSNKNAGNRNINVSIDVLGCTEVAKLANFEFIGAAVAASGTISKREVTITWIKVADKFYDGTDSATLVDYAYSGTVEGELVSVRIRSGGLKFSQVNAGDSLTVSVPKADVLLSGSNSGNYTLNLPAQVTTTAAIKPILIRFTAPQYNKIYDRTTTFNGSDYQFVITTTLPGKERVVIVYDTGVAPVLATEKADVLTTLSFKNLVLRLADDSVGGNLANYKLDGSDNSGIIADYVVSAIISKATIKAVVQNVTMVYGDTATYKDTKYTINNLPIVFNIDDSKWYCDFDNNGTFNATEEIEEFYPVIPYSEVGRKTNIGTYIVKGLNGYSQNYVFEITSGTIEITPAPLTFTVPSVDRYYGASVDLDVNWVGFKNGDTASKAIRIKPVLSTTAVSDSPIASYPITVESVGVAYNYTISAPAAEDIGVVNVVMAQVTGTQYTGLISVIREINGVDTKVYIKTTGYSGAGQPMYCTQLNGEYGYGYSYYNAEGTLVARESFAYKFSNSVAANFPTSPVNAGSYKVVVSVCKLLNGQKNPGWEEETVYGELTINPVAPMLTISNKEAVFSGAPITIGTAITSENIPVTYVYKNGSTVLTSAPTDAGTYTVVVTLVTSSSDATIATAIKNYTPMSKTVTLKITKQKLNVSVPTILFIEGSVPSQIEFTSPNNDVLTGLIFEEGTDITKAGTYSYTINVKEEYKNNYEVVGGIGYITVGKNNITTSSGALVTVENNTIIGSDVSVNVTNVPYNKKAAEGSASKLLWAQAEGLTVGDDIVQAIISVELLKGENAISIQPSGALKITLSDKDSKFKASDRVYLMKQGELVEVDAELVDGKMVITSDEVGDFVVMRDGTAKKNALYATIALAGLALTGVAMLIVIRKVSVLKLLKAAVKATK